MKSHTESRVHLDERIVRYIEEKRLNVNGIYQDLARKREFLRDVLGYSRLRIRKNQFASLKECNDERISVVVKEVYSSAKKRLEKYRREHEIPVSYSRASLEKTVQSVDF